MDEVTSSQLRSLEQHPGWAAYLRVADELITEQIQAFARKCMARDMGGITEGELQYRRGMVRGIQMISRTPQLERKKFEKAFANQEDEAVA